MTGLRNRSKNANRCVTDVATADEVLFDKEMTYPQGFPDIKKVINGFVIEPQSFRTLMPFQSNDEYLDDNVINAFFSFLPGIAERKKFSFLCFDTYICESILRQGFVSDGFHKWASTIAMVKYPVWLIPIHYANHWTLLMIVHPRKIIVLYDSLHGNHNEKIVGEICHFIEEHININSWDEWTLHTPKDVPIQKMNDNVGGNCGVHICTWGYIIASGSYTPFCEEDMSAARKGIANYLVNGVSNKRIEKQIIKYRNVVLSNNEKRLNTSTKFNWKELKKSENPPFHFIDMFQFTSSLYLIIQNETLQPETRSQRNRLHKTKEK